MTDTTRRPMLFMRVKFDIEDPSRGWLRGDMGAWVKSVFETEKEELYRELVDINSLSAQAKVELRRETNWVVRLLADIDADLVLPTGERRFRLYRGGQGEWVQQVLRDAQADLYADLATLREHGKSEDDPEVADVRTKLQWSVTLLRDCDMCLIQLVGPDEDQRG